MHLSLFFRRTGLGLLLGDRDALLLARRRFLGHRCTHKCGLSSDATAECDRKYLSLLALLERLDDREEYRRAILYLCIRLGLVDQFHGHLTNVTDLE